MNLKILSRTGLRMGFDKKRRSDMRPNAHCHDRNVMLSKLKVKVLLSVSMGRSSTCEFDDCQCMKGLKPSNCITMFTQVQRVCPLYAGTSFSDSASSHIQA